MKTKWNDRPTLVRCPVCIRSLVCRFPLTLLPFFPKLSGLIAKFRGQRSVLVLSPIELADCKSFLAPLSHVVFFMTSLSVSFPPLQF